MPFIGCEEKMGDDGQTAPYIVEQQTDNNDGCLFIGCEEKMRWQSDRTIVEQQTDTNDAFYWVWREDEITVSRAKTDTSVSFIECEEN